MKKKIIIGSITGVALLLMLSLIIGFNAKKTEVVLEKDIQIPINSSKYNTDYIKEIKNGKLISAKEEINTKSLGKQEITIKVENNWGQEKEYTYIVNIYDDEKPKITFNSQLKTEEGTEIDLLKGVSAEDNSQEPINVTIEGEWDYRKSGSYTLYYVAKDSSQNETKEEFTVTVTAKPKVTTNPSTTPNKNPNTTPAEKTFTTSKGFTGVTKNGITYIDGYLIVNKTYSLPSTYGSSLTTKTKEAFNKMQAAARLDGIDLYISSGYRSYQTQKKLYNNYVNRDGVAKADTYSARPGHSEHQSGLAFDVCSHDLDGKNACINSNFDSTSQAKWLAENCYKYGLILRYPSGKTNETGYKYESWHFRYVGEELATKLYNQGNWITLEDYFGITSTY